MGDTKSISSLWEDWAKLKGKAGWGNGRGKKKGTPWREVKKGGRGKGGSDQDSRIGG